MAIGFKRYGDGDKRNQTDKIRKQSLTNEARMGTECL